MPAPFLMARSMVSLVTEDFLAFSTATNNRALSSGSAPPSLAATMISRTSLTTIWPFLCALASRPACFHCAPIRFATVWKIYAGKKTKLFQGVCLIPFEAAEPTPSPQSLAESFHNQSDPIYGTYWRRKKPRPLVMKMYWEFVMAVGENNPPFTFAHADLMPGSN